jgi:hypothetical protein
MQFRELLADGGVLRRLARDRAGNTLAIVAASILPLLALVGGGIDMGRAYLAQSRLQQACDAGVLAARKKLGSPTSLEGGVPAAVIDAGGRFFNLNFRDGAYGTEDRDFQMSIDDELAMSGVATVHVPTTVMRIFGQQYLNVTAKCQAQVNSPDSDIMLVLDTTGSMNSKNPGESVTRMQAMRAVVKAFHAQVEKGKSLGTKIRYGFVPYSTNVNVGYLLKSGWMVDEWEYNARVAKKTGTKTTVTNYDETQTTVSGNWSEMMPFSAKSCPDSTVVVTEISKTTNKDGSSTGRNKVDGNFFYCDYDPDTGGMTVNGTSYNKYTYDWTKTPNGTKSEDNYRWQYRSIKVDVSALKGDADEDLYKGGTIGLPIGDAGSGPPKILTGVLGGLLGGGGTPVPSSTFSVMKATFEGCIEERDTYEIGDYKNVDLDKALDLDIDLVPDPSDPDTQWRPILPQLSYLREIDEYFKGKFNPSPVNSVKEMFNSRTNLWGADYASCPSRAKKLAPMTNQEITDYLNTLVAKGNTYHDIGMIWGGRLLSPTGLFADENEGSGNVSRHLIFLTDGETAPNKASYGTYGVEPLDRRRWDEGSKLSLTETVEARFAVACDQVKTRNITVWVIGFGTAISNLMKQCAGDNQWFEAEDSDELAEAFATIGNAINELRITQ